MLKHQTLPSVAQLFLPAVSPTFSQLRARHAHAFANPLAPGASRPPYARGPVRDVRSVKPGRALDVRMGCRLKTCGTADSKVCATVHPRGQSCPRSILLLAIIT